jgi:hypothetical protein
MIDLKCFTRRSARRILASVPVETPIVASTRTWWTLGPFRRRANTRVLRSCGARWQLWWVLHRSSFDDRTGVCLHEQRLTPEVLRALRRRTPLIFSWGARSTERCNELAAAGITGIILDDYSLVRPNDPEDPRATSSSAFG